ncbi:MAG: hypothetical protein WCZ28_17180, partial [Burkholderiaceae bacterium]
MTTERADTTSGPGTAELARRAMRLMAARRLAPTPENYRLAWLEVGGREETPGPARSRENVAEPADRG